MKRIVTAPSGRQNQVQGLKPYQKGDEASAYGNLTRLSSAARPPVRFETPPLPYVPHLGVCTVTLGAYRRWEEGQ